MRSPSVGRSASKRDARYRFVTLATVRLLLLSLPSSFFRRECIQGVVDLAIGLTRCDRDCSRHAITSPPAKARCGSAAVIEVEFDPTGGTLGGEIEEHSSSAQNSAFGSGVIRWANLLARDLA